MPPILPTSRKRPAHGQCDEFWHGTGQMPFRLECEPRFDFARQTHELSITSEGALFQANGQEVVLHGAPARSVRETATSALISHCKPASSGGSCCRRRRRGRRSRSTRPRRSGCSEEIDPSGRQIGNFPQAFTHLALLHAAIDLDAALNTGGAPVFQGPGGLGLPTVLNLAAGRAFTPQSRD